MNLKYFLNSFLSKVLPTAKTKHFFSQNYRKFTIYFFAATFTPLISVGLFNIAVDPYGIFFTPVLNGFNKAKPEKFNQDLLFKAVEITRLRPTTIILGSSKEQWGIDPNHPELAKDGNTYDLGLQAANMYTVRRYFEHALANQPNIKRVIVGIDFSMFNTNIKVTQAFKENRLEKRFIAWEDAINILFSWDSFKVSQKTFKINRKNINKNSIFVSRFIVEDQIFTAGRLIFAEDEILPGSQQKFFRGMARELKNPTPYQLSQESLDNLELIVEICQQKDIDIRVFIAPSHASNTESLNLLGLWSEFEKWKQEIVKITPVWDFSGYNSITTEPIKDDMKYYIDSFHYNKDAGDLILNRLLSYQENKVPNDFGVLITPKNIESHLDEIHKKRDIWLKDNPHILELVISLKQK